MQNILVSFLLVTYAAASQAANEAPANPVVTYQMDLFSIISFALAIAAFVVSVFMGWLSWEFYKKSAEASEKSQQAVTKIEAAVLNIQSEITEIVRRAVGYWTGDAGEKESTDAAILAQRVEDISEQIKAVSGNAANKQELDEKVAELVRLQREQISALASSIAETKARAIFPNIVDRGPVAEVTHTMTINTPTDASGQLFINVLRPSKVVTVTPRFDAPFSHADELSVELTEAPEMARHAIRLTSGIGRGAEFNVHLHAFGGLLTSGFVDPGAYVVTYKAKASKFMA